MRRSLLVLLVVSCLACTKPTATTNAPVTTCTKAEQQCVYADGKIGLCTASSMDCDGGTSCLVCMSLH
jgi:hypothetical protein